MNYISSKENNIIKDLVKLRDDSTFRNDKSLFYVEGERIICDSPANLINKVFILDKYKDKFLYFLEKVPDDKVYILSEIVYNKIKSTTNSQGIIATICYNKKSLYDYNNLFYQNNNIIILDNINDPGNLGTIIRLSEALNIKLLIVSSDSCDIGNPKVIRACMSSIFRVNIIVSNDIISDIKYLKDMNYSIVSTSLDNDSVDIDKFKFNSKNAIILGNEANGIKKSIIDYSDYKVKIPMYGEIESFNVAVAASIVCYEAMRQKNEIK